MTRRRSRIRRRFDMRRLALAITAPGIDTRTWLEKARIDDDDDAVRWDDALGWIADVTIQGGALDQEGPIACRICTSFTGNTKGLVEPVTRGQLVMVLLPEGRPDVQPTIVGALYTPDLPAPTSVNGIDIDEDVAKTTHILVTEHDMQQEVGEKWRTSATSRATLEAPEIRLADEDAAQAAVRGTDQKDAFGDFLTSFDTWAGLVQSGIIAAGGTLVNTTILSAVLQLRTKLSDALSTKVKLE